MREDLKKLVLERAKLKARNLGYKFTSMAETDLKIFINNGIDRMTPSQYLSDIDNQRAIKNIELLIEKMQLDAKSRYLNEDLDYKSFSTARGSICPLWPFC